MQSATRMICFVVQLTLGNSIWTWDEKIEATTHHSLTHSQAPIGNPVSTILPSPAISSFRHSAWLTFILTTRLPLPPLQALFDSVSCRLHQHELVPLVLSFVGEASYSPVVRHDWVFATIHRGAVSTAWVNWCLLITSMASTRSK